MSSCVNPHQRLRSRLRSENAIALPAVLVMLLIISALSTAAVSAATDGASQSVRDRGVKGALAALDGGLHTALYRTNKVPHQANECVTAGADGTLTVTAPAADGWCPQQTEDLGDGASYTYRVSPGTPVVQNGQNLVQRKVVATGCVLAAAGPSQCMANGGVTRRGMADVASLNANLFGAGGVLSKETLTVENNAFVGANVTSNDDVVINNNGEICGNVTYGPSAGDDFVGHNNATFDCPGTSARKASQEFLLNPIDGNGARTNNDNDNFFGTDAMIGSATWDAANRVLRISNGSSVTLTGDTYSFCSPGDREQCPADRRAACRRPAAAADLHRQARELCRRGIEPGQCQGGEQRRHREPDERSGDASALRGGQHDHRNKRSIS